MSTEKTTPATSRASHCYAVGDQLAFDCGFGRGHWKIATIDKITPSGRIVCGLFTLNPDLTIRGHNGYGPYRGQPVTDEIRAKVKRQENLSIISGAKFSEMSEDVLDEIVKLIKSS